MGKIQKEKSLSRKDINPSKKDTGQPKGIWIQQILLEVDPGFLLSLLRMIVIKKTNKK